MNVYEYDYFIWGTGENSNFVNECYFYEIGKINLIGYIDNDMNKQGKVHHGKQIYSPEILKGRNNCKIIIANKYRKEIMKQIEDTYPLLKDNIAEKDFWIRLQMLTRYESEKDSEIRECCDYLMERPLTIFNYTFTDKYQAADIQVYYDSEKKLYFVYYCGKKMYISRSYTSEEEVRTYINSVILEQDTDSPHRYLMNNYNVSDDDIVIDAGVAEGNFALSIIDKVRKIYLFEPDANWIEALKYTFEEYSEKIVMIEKGLSNYQNAITTTIDSIVPRDENINLIKMDIEGEELLALKGARETIEHSADIKCIICTYHHENAYEAVREFFSEEGFHVEHSCGYMWYPNNYNMMRAPVLRRGLIRSERKTI